MGEENESAWSIQTVCLCVYVCMNPKPTLSCLPQPALSKQQGGRGLVKTLKKLVSLGAHRHTHTHTNKRTRAADRQ